MAAAIGKLKPSDRQNSAAPWACLICRAFIDPDPIEGKPGSGANLPNRRNRCPGHLSAPDFSGSSPTAPSVEMKPPSATILPSGSYPPLDLLRCATAVTSIAHGMKPDSTQVSTEYINLPQSIVKA